MSYLPELHYCCVCRIYLGPDNGDAICATCEDALVPCSECDQLKMPDEECGPCAEYADYLEHGPTNSTFL